MYIHHLNLLLLPFLPFHLPLDSLAVSQRRACSRKHAWIDVSMMILKGPCSLSEVRTKVSFPRGTWAPGNVHTENIKQVCNSLAILNQRTRVQQQQRQGKWRFYAAY